MIFRRGKHRTQYDGSALATENCTPTSLANNIREATGGRLDYSGAAIRAIVKRSEEQNPDTPGWSLQDAQLAAKRLGLQFVIKSGSGWQGVRDARAAGYGIVLQGDSEEFPLGCSSKFDGDHAIYVHPENSGTRYLKGDPICPDWQWEEGGILRKYAENFSPTVRFGYINIPIPKIGQETEPMAQAPHTTENPTLIDIPAGAVVYDLDGTTAIGKTNVAYTGRISPFATSNARAIYFGTFTPAARKTVLVRSFSNERPVPGASPAELAAAKAAGVSQEKGRLRQLLGL